MTVQQTKHTHSLWKALVGGVVATAMLVGANAMPAYAAPQNTTGGTASPNATNQPTTSPSPSGTASGGTASPNAGDGTAHGSTPQSGSGAGTNAGTSSDANGNGASPDAGKGNAGTGAGGANGSDNAGGNGSGDAGSTGDSGNKGNAGTGNGSGESGNGSHGGDSGDSGSQTPQPTPIDAPTAITLDGPALAATINEGTKDKPNDVTYRLVNGDAWSLRITAPKADKLQITGWYSLDGTTACTTDQDRADATKCAELKADNATIAEHDGDGVFTYRPGDGVYDLAALSVTALPAPATDGNGSDGKTAKAQGSADAGTATQAPSQPVTLAALAGKGTSNLKDVNRLVVDTAASAGTTLAMDANAVNGVDGYVDAVTSFTIANPSPLFVQRTRILAAQPDTAQPQPGSINGSKRPQLLKLGDRTFADAREAKAVTDPKTGKVTGYAITVDAAEAGRDAFAKDGEFVLDLNSGVYGDAFDAQAQTKPLTKRFTVDAVDPAAPAKGALKLADGETPLKGTEPVDETDSGDAGDGSQQPQQPANTATVWMVNGDHTLLVTPAADPAGVKTVTVTSGGKATELKDADADGAYEYDLKAGADGTEIDLTKAEITVTDNAGRTSAPVALGDVPGIDLDRLVLDNPQTITADVVGNQFKPGAPLTGLFYDTIEGVSFTGHGRYFNRRMTLLKAIRPAIDLVTVTQAHEGGDIVTPYKSDALADPASPQADTVELEFTRFASGRFTLAVARDAEAYLPKLDATKLAGEDRQGFTVDATDPSIHDVTFAKDDANARDLGAKRLVVNAATAAPTLTVDADDLNADGTTGSGIASVTMNARFLAIGNDGKLGEPADENLVAVRDAATGAYVITFGREGAYDLSASTVTATDGVGRTATYELSRHADRVAFTTLYVTRTGKGLADDFAVTPNVTPDPSKPFNALQSVTVTARSKWFPTLVGDLAGNAGRLAVLKGTSDSGAAYTLYADGTPDGDTGRGFTLALDASEFDRLDAAKANGNHTLAPADPFNGADATFRYDDRPAAITKAEYHGNAQDTNEDHVITTFGGDTARSLTFTAKDLLPGDREDADRTAGVKTVTVANGSDVRTLTPDENGDVTYVMAADPKTAVTAYDLTAITVVASDGVNEATPETIADLVRRLDVKELRDVTAIRITNADKAKSISTEILVNGRSFGNSGAYVNATSDDPDHPLPEVTLRVSGNHAFPDYWKAAAGSTVPVLVSTLAAAERTGDETADQPVQPTEPVQYGTAILDSYEPANAKESSDSATPADPNDPGDGEYLVHLKTPSGGKPLMDVRDNGMYTLSLGTALGATQSDDAKVLAVQKLFGHFVDPATGRDVADDATDGSADAAGYETGAADVQLGIDNQKPTFTGLAYEAQPADLRATVNGEEEILAGGTRTVSFDVRDLLTARGASAGVESPDVSGIGEVRATVKVEGFDGRSDDEARDIELTPSADRTHYTMTIGANGDGIYRLSNIEVSVGDQAQRFDEDASLEPSPNTVTGTLADLKETLGLDDATMPDVIGVSTASPVTSVQINGADVAPYYTGSIDSIALRVTDDPAFTFRQGIITSTAYAGTSVFAGSAVSYAGKADSVAGPTLQHAEFAPAADGNGGTISWLAADDANEFDALFKPLPDGSGRYNGDYRIVTALGLGSFGLLPNAADATFTLDTVRPAVTAVSGATGSEATDLVRGYAVAGQPHDVYAKAGRQQIVVTVKDLLPASQPGSDRTAPTVDQLGTAGIVRENVTYDIPAATDLAGAELAPAVHGVAQVNGDGTFIVPFDREGLYDLSRITVNAVDHAGNAMQGDSVLADDVVRTGVNYDAIVADVDDDNRVAVTVTDDSGLPSNRPDYFHRGTVTVSYAVTDKWFPLYQRLTGINQGDLLAGTVGNTSPQTTSDVIPAQAVKVTDGGWTQQGYDWTLAGQRILLDGNVNEAEGKYDLAFAYAGLQAAPNDGARYAGEFVLDWTAPTLGDLTSSSTDPSAWNWIFAPGGVTVTLAGVSDPVSGICSVRASLAPGASGVQSDCASSQRESVAFSALSFDNRIADAGAHPAPAVAYSGSTAAGGIAFSFDGDSQRLTLGGTAITLTDAAGNPVDTGALNAYAGVNDNPAISNVQGVDGIAIDSTAPSLAIAYDNNDVRNDKYYKAHRTGTVTLVETNFDFSQRNEADRAIVTTTVDGRQATVPVSAFANPSGDLKTYVASFGADEDGDWTADASYTDPGRHAADPFHDEFTVDTVAPVLTLTFDNNDARNGIYYAADRTATIREVERNFSGGESVITTTAKDDAGADAVAPGPGDWQRTGGERETTEWTSTVAFTGEAHFTIGATATDLAGNVGVAVNAPEFVVDKTKPHISIDRVDDRTAYAGTVAPLISFDDANIDLNQVTYTLTGDHRGQLKEGTLPTNVVNDTANDRRVDFSDFERKPDVDDVYTLTARATDMAGNQYETTKTFSVNRFGSTYTFTADTQSLRGTYLRQAKDVTITEINVSGLSADKHQLVVAKDDKAATLGDGDYQVTPSDDKGWSQTTYTVPASRFAQDGFYRVQVQSMDNAGNLSQNTMNQKDAARTGTAEVNFAVDSTAPTAALLGAESGSVYYERDGRRIAVDAKDNLGIKTAKVYVDNQLRDTWQGDELLKGTPTLVLSADDTDHMIEIRTVDMAGNQATATYDNIYVASSWWQYVSRTAWIRNTMIFGALLLLAAIAAAIIIVQQRRRRLAYRDNPFDR